MGSAPEPTVFDAADDFVNELDLEERFGGHTCIDLIARLTECHYRFYYCSRFLAGRSYEDPSYGPAREFLDVALLHLYKAKWLIGGITGSYKGVRVAKDRDGDALAGWHAMDEVLRIVAGVQDALQGRTGFDAIEATPPLLDSEGTEVLRSDGFPVVPSICPVVVVRGSSYEMGYQYAEQVLEIYGDFVFREFAELRFTPRRLEELRRHEAQLAAHTPEILEMCRGWADAVSDGGLPMAYEHVVHLWSSTEAPPKSLAEASWPFLGSPQLLAAMYFGQQAFINAARQSLAEAQATPESAAAVAESPLEHCSGFCAWSDATKDGRVKAASTTDHDCWMQAAIVAYPDTGHPFIYTPFSVHGGWIPGLGLSTMGGHPGMNNRGVAFAHHGGEPHVMEPPHSWGYGVGRGACTFHGLRFAASAAQAHDQVMSYPIGNVGTAMAIPGGQWADAGAGYVFESRYRSAEHPDGLVRRATLDATGGEHAFLYTGNSALHPDAPSANHGHDAGVLQYDVENGWHTSDPAALVSDSLTVSAMRMTANARGAGRNRFFYKLAMADDGRIDSSWVERLYLTAPADTPDAADTERWHQQVLAGELAPQFSPAHRGNAFTAIMLPDDGPEGLYHACIGPLRYDLPANGASHGYYYYDETNAYWTLRLADTAEEVLVDARNRADTLQIEAAALIDDLEDDYAGRSYLDAFLDKARAADSEGRAISAALKHAHEPREASAILARALRRFTTAQVRARQVINALRPVQPLPVEGFDW